MFIQDFPPSILFEIIFQCSLLILDFLFSRYQQLKYELVKDEDGQALNMIRELRIIAFNHDKQGVLGKKSSIICFAFTLGLLDLSLYL